MFLPRLNIFEKKQIGCGYNIFFFRIKLKHKKILKIVDSKRNGPNIRSAYLGTYSQVAETWTRETFANAVVSQFESAEARVRE